VTDAIGVCAASAGAGGAHPSQVGPQQLQHAPAGMPEWGGALWWLAQSAAWLEA